MTIASALRSERGVALIIALVVVLILAAITLAMGFMTSAEVDIHRMSRWDTLAQYLGQAGVEHQIYLLKENKDTTAVPYQEYPRLPGYPAGRGPFWYVTALTCTLNCTGNPSSRRWTITSDGEVRRFDPATATWTLLQKRTIRAQVEITYVTCGALTNRCPSGVTLLRWERVEP